jgi:hypothetical protein
MFFDRAGGDNQRFGDFGVGQAGGDQFQNFHFSLYRKVLFRILTAKI